MPRMGLLFWKLMVSFWLAMLSSLLAGVLYLMAVSEKLPEPPHSPLIPLISGAAVSLIFSAGLAWHLSRPLRHLRWGLRRVAEERYETRVQPLVSTRRRDEIAALAVEFDLMASRLQELTTARRNLLHDLSHELRSPLARMHAALGLAAQNPEDASNLPSRIGLEVQRMDALVEKLLTLHRLEAAGQLDGGPVFKARIDLIDLLGAIVEDAYIEARATGRRLSFKSDGPFVATVDGELIYRAYENVVRNAVKYAAPGSLVEIDSSVSKDGRMLQVAVADRGPGVPADKLQGIFEPFVRLDETAESRGSGLGLAMAKRIVELHGGRIWASERTGGGLVVNIEIPHDPL